jgi:hypothetical protein
LPTKEERAAIESEIRDVGALRKSWIEAHQNAEPADSFDRRVAELIERQAQTIGVAFE